MPEITEADIARVLGELSVIKEMLPAVRRNVFSNTVFAIKNLYQQRNDLKKALDAAESVLWMADSYARSSGSGSLEMRDFQEVISIINSVSVKNADDHNKSS